MPKHHHSDDEADEILEEQRSLNKCLVLLGDPETKTWNVSMQGTDREEVHQHYLEMKADKTPAIFIDTSDFVVL
jgi:hypothetical protein